ncbi:MAG: hypothetical protein U5K76_11260 [Woeseiaceae bacterium]|nr:hypothetical protein [Woeseiaceae bacterium]
MTLSVSNAGSGTRREREAQRVLVAGDRIHVLADRRRLGAVQFDELLAFVGRARDVVLDFDVADTVDQVPARDHVVQRPGAVRQLRVLEAAVLDQVGVRGQGRTEEKQRGGQSCDRLDIHGGSSCDEPAAHLSVSMGNKKQEQCQPR